MISILCLVKLFAIERTKQKRYLITHDDGDDDDDMSYI